MTIIELRRRQNALAVRFATISEAVESIFALTVPFTETLAKASVNAWNHSFAGREGYEWDEPPEHEYHRMIGTDISVASEDFFFPLVYEAVGASNIAHELKEIRKNAKAGPDPIPSEWLAELVEPESLHWRPEEVETVKRSYRKRITAATTKIRDINTTWKYLSKQESHLPKFIKPSLLGMFGSADLVTNFQYTDVDFKWQPHGQKPKVMTARWLAPFIGIEKAGVVEVAVQTIGIASAPLPGEPPTLDFFGSHVSNIIKLFEDD